MGIFAEAFKKDDSRLYTHNNLNNSEFAQNNSALKDSKNIKSFCIN